MTASCPRLDLLGQSPSTNSFRARVLKLPKYVTYDHVFAQYRTTDEDSSWYLKTKPIKHPVKTELEKRLSLQYILQTSDSHQKKQKLKPKDYDVLVNVVAKALPLPDMLVKKNSLEKRPKVQGDLENLKATLRSSVKPNEGP